MNSDNVRGQNSIPTPRDPRIHIVTPLIIQTVYCNSTNKLYYSLRRPLYQYESANPPTSTGPAIQSGFPTAAAINLSVKCIAAASTGMKPLPLPLPLPLTRSPGTVSVMDLSTSSVTSTSPQVRYTAPRIRQKLYFYIWFFPVPKRIFNRYVFLNGIYLPPLDRHVFEQPKPAPLRRDRRPPHQSEHVDVQPAGHPSAESSGSDVGPERKQVRRYR